MDLRKLVTRLKRKQRETGDEGHRSAREHSEQTKPESPSHTFRHYNHPSEEEHRTAEQFNWRDSYRLNVGIAIVAVIGALFAAGSFFESKRQADIAQKTLVQTNRAWMTVQVNAAMSTLTWQKDTGPILNYSVTTKNIGNSPALEVRIWAYLFFTSDNPEENINSIIKKPCYFKQLSGNVAFPTEEWMQVVGNWMAFDISSKFEAVAARILNETKGLTFVPLTGVACVSYKIFGDEKTHYTIRSFRISTTSPLNQGWLTYMRDVKAGGMVLYPQSNGDYTD